MISQPQISTDLCGSVTPQSAVRQAVDVTPSMLGALRARRCWSMNDWGSTTFGDPCRECGFSWTISPEAAIRVVRALPREYAHSLTGTTGRERHRDLSWTVGAYVCHVGDNLRIWAERLAGVAAGAGSLVGAYDQDLLAEARRYEEIALEAGMWSLGRAVTAWVAAVEQARAADAVLRHPERGDLAVTDVVRANSHDAFHHGWDIQRSVSAP